MSKGLGRVELAIIEAIKEYPGSQKNLDECLYSVRAKLGMQENTTSNQASISRALNSLKRKGIINTYWLYIPNDDSSRSRKKYIKLQHPGTREKTIEEYAQEASRLVSRLDILLSIKLKDYKFDDDFFYLVLAGLNHVITEVLEIREKDIAEKEVV